MFNTKSKSETQSNASDSLVAYVSQAYFQPILITLGDSLFSILQFLTSLCLDWDSTNCLHLLLKNFQPQPLMCPMNKQLLNTALLCEVTVTLTAILIYLYSLRAQCLQIHRLPGSLQQPCRAGVASRRWQNILICLLVLRLQWLEQCLVYDCCPINNFSPFFHSYRRLRGERVNKQRLQTWPLYSLIAVDQEAGDTQVIGGKFIHTGGDFIRGSQSLVELFGLVLYLKR